MGFQGGLPQTKSMHDHLFAVVNLFSKIVCSILCKTVPSEEVAMLFFQHAWKNFILPSIILDRDSHFSHFWKTSWG